MMRNRNTVEFLGLWETLNNPNFNPLEFKGFRLGKKNGDRAHKESCPQFNITL